MFLLETEYFVWDFIAWTVNFLLAALAIFLIAVVVKKSGKSFPVESRGYVIGEREPFSAGAEKYLWIVRKDVFEVWLEQPWVRIAAPLFLLLLFLAAVYAG